MSSDEAGTLARLKRVRNNTVEPKVKEHHGRIVKLTGDGILAEFQSVVNAVSCAVDMQRQLQEEKANVAPEQQIEFRIGINLGDVIVEDEDIYGDGVNVAARLESIAPPGGITVSSSVRDHIGNRLDLVFEDRGEQQLKNISTPVRAFDVQADGLGASPVSQKQQVKPSIAVLPFTNMSGDPEQEYFSDGITEDIITDLSKVSGLLVVSRHSTFSYKGKQLKVQQVGRELGVSFVLEGSVRKAGARLRVTGQLVNCKDGGHLWAERYDRDLTDIFAIQDEITHAIVEQLKVKLLPEEKKSIARAPTQSIDAYNYYLKGRDFLRRRSRRYLRLAREMFLKATEIDPNCARAYAGIAICDSFLFMTYHVDVPADAMLNTAAKALALDNKLPEPHAARGVAFTVAHRYDEARTEFEQALSLDPTSADTLYFYARSNFVQGKVAEAAELFQRAAAADPEDYQSPCLLVGLYTGLGRTEDAKRSARLGLERAERELGRHPEDSRPAQIGAAALFALGERDRAREWTERSLAIDPDDLVAQYNAVCTYAMLGEIDLALDWLERCLPKLGQEKVTWAKYDSDLDPLRNHPRFQQLLERLN